MRSEGAYKKSVSPITVLAQELTSPLASSRSALAMLLAGDLGELSASQREYLEQVLKLDDYMIGLIGSWVDMERLSRGQVVLEVEPCNVGAILGEVAGERVSMPRSGQWPMVLADRLRLKQIFMNIVDELTDVEVRARILGDSCVVTIQEQAAYNPKQRAAILEALHTNAPTSRLGIRIARLLAEAHGGGLELDPHASTGLKLRLKLPLAKQMSLLGEIIE